ncbi:MAG: nucleotide sugar dehydrogenase, partial [Coprothermobacterota bacterium]|nr:nucleotide sugar dehydrogenase [Coprothermobacterota bacterium]
MKTLEEKIADKESRMVVVGLGYVGLPLALAFVEAGFAVMGLEKDAGRIESLRRGESYIDDIPSQRLKAAVDCGFQATLSVREAYAEADAVFICVPTPLTITKDPDLSFIQDAGEAFAPFLRPGNVVLLESTTYPGTTEEVLLPILTRGGMQVGKDFFLAFSPERVDPGNKSYDIRNTPKVVGGVTPRCTELAASLYRQVADDVVLVSSTRVAEM